MLSRRAWIRGGLAAVASAKLALALVPPGASLGVQLYSVGDDLQRDVAGTLRQLKLIGYGRVETAGLAGLTAQQLKAHLDAAGLTCRSTHLQLRSGSAALGIGTSSSMSDELKRLFDDAHALGAQYVVSSAIFAAGSAANPTAEDYRRMAGSVNQLAQHAKAAGLQYAYHNHNFEFRKLGNGQAGYDVLLERFDPALVMLEMDCGWVVKGGYRPEQLFAAHPGRYRMLHIKDFTGGPGVVTSLAPGVRPQGTELGHGFIDYKPILAAASKAGITDLYVEQEPPFPDMPPMKAMAVDFDYLHRLTASVK